MVVRLFLVAESSRWWYNKIIFIRQEIDNFLVLKEEIMDRVCVVPCKLYFNGSQNKLNGVIEYDKAFGI